MEKVVVVGAGQAAAQAAASLRQKKFAGNIAVLGEESWHPYQRPPLSKRFLAGEMSAERLNIKPPDYYRNAEIDMHLGTRATSIDRSDRSVQTANGAHFDYDKLIIATGSRPRPLQLDGANLRGVHCLRGIDDVNNIRDQLGDKARIVIVGAGYIGLEVAAVAVKLGHDVTVVEVADRVMSRVVSAELSSFYREMHEANGVQILTSAAISGIEGDDEVAGVALQSGETLPADVVIVGIGIVPNTELAADAGIEVADGIVVDERCQTSDANIWAAGDCTRHPNAIMDDNIRLESVQNAIEQGKTAASNIAGEESRYSQVPWFWSDQYDLKLQIAGLSGGFDETVIRGDMQSHSFACLYLKEGRLIALDAVNRPRDFVQAKGLIANHVIIESDRLADIGIDLKDM